MADNKSKKTTAVKKITSQTLPAAEALKTRFKAGSIPLQSDFAELIDMAETGRRAVGGAPDQSGPGYGMELSNTGQLSVDMNVVIPKGIITMFSGTTVPDGWALCDGSGDTPNLIDRFILGGKLAHLGGVSGNTVEGGKNNKYYSVPSDAQGGVTSHTVNVKPYALQLHEMPRHEHLGGVKFDSDSYMEFGRKIIAGSTEALQPATNSDAGSKFLSYTDTVGESKPHKHDATVDLPNHIHHISVTTPYYILAFIIKL